MIKVIFKTLNSGGYLFVILEHFLLSPFFWAWWYCLFCLYCSTTM